jgi:hypothetical protein
MTSGVHVSRKSEETAERREGRESVLVFRVIFFKSLKPRPSSRIFSLRRRVSQDRSRAKGSKEKEHRRHKERYLFGSNRCAMPLSTSSITIQERVHTTTMARRKPQSLLRAHSSSTLSSSSSPSSPSRSPSPSSSPPPPLYHTSSSVGYTCSWFGKLCVVVWFNIQRLPCSCALFRT